MATWGVTGASGFFGQEAVTRLVSEGHVVHGLDIAACPEKLEKLEGYTHHQVDIRDAKGVRQALRPCDRILHAAAGLPSLRNRAEIYSINIDGTRNVLTVARATGARVVFVSTTAVYGLHDVHPITEELALVPVGPYGESKIVAEQLCEQARKHLHVSIIRPKTFLAKGRLGVFEILFDWIKEGHRIPLIGPGHNRYQLLHLQDLLDICFLAAEHKDGSDTFNAAAETFGSLREDLSPLFEAAGQPVRFLPAPKVPSILALTVLDKLRLSPLTKWHYGTMAQDSYVEIEKAKRVLGWAPKYSNQEILLESYEWYHANHASLEGRTGVGHTVGWDQKALRILKKFV